MKLWGDAKSRSNETMRSLVAFSAVPDAGVTLDVVHVTPPASAVSCAASVAAMKLALGQRSVGS